MAHRLLAACPSLNHGRRLLPRNLLACLVDVIVQGSRVDDATRCEHWSGPHDIVAFCFPCCGDWYPCRRCHDEHSDHDAETWGPTDLGEHAVLCGECRATLAIGTYLDCGHTCPSCGAGFNPGCVDHWDRYFDLPETL